ncbi:hypothetical protein ACH5RR_029361 [Cinchona calisaya]|uniref:Uncharacterized protein n=1 Tax=Cinchona calisaya TaxID=153742 RepID=A0ABD2YRF2_9GENT
MIHSQYPIHSNIFSQYRMIKTLIIFLQVNMMCLPFFCYPIFQDSPNPPQHNSFGRCMYFRSIHFSCVPLHKSYKLVDLFGVPSIFQECLLKMKLSHSLLYRDDELRISVPNVDK